VTSGRRTVAAIVLAGGASRRFGSDKLAADLGGRSVLDHALDGLPVDAAIAIVGPERTMGREVTFLREDPPAGGPAAGLIVGLEWALTVGAEQIVTLPGDAPGAGRAASLLLAALAESARSAEMATVSAATEITAVVGVDRTGREQVLQLALRPPAARALLEIAGPDRGRGESVRRLLSTLTPAPRTVPLPDELTGDIDTIDQLRRFTARWKTSPEPR
jgi:molybdopterin-guanine dinucleotide biosynthesis protein A